MKYVFLDHHPTNPDYVLHQLRACLEKQGHSVTRVCVTKGDELIKPIDLSCTLDIHAPDRIVWQGGVGHAFMDVWNNESWNKVPKISLNYDEPFSRICGTMMEDAWIESGKRDDFYIGIWDGYWRRKVKERWGMNSLPIHLAVNEDKYQPHPTLASDEIIFFGMFQSPTIIIGRYNQLPKDAQNVIKKIDNHCRRVEQDSFFGRKHWGILECGEVLIEQAGGKDILESLSGIHQRLMRWCAWALAKNCMRAQLLRNILKKLPVVMYCDTAQLGHARVEEIYQIIGKGLGQNLYVNNTSGWTPEMLALIPCYGKVHLQATDPQSMEGGIPWRVFQCAASGKALYTDRRPELDKAFTDGIELISYDNRSDPLQWLQFNMSMENNLEEIGVMARERFLKEHTWAHRIADWDKWIVARQAEACPDNLLK